jgi:hypothetical protein
MARNTRRRSLSEMLAEIVRIPPLQYFDLHVFVQLNDVYFLDARANDANPDGLLLPRIATMVKRLKAELPGRVTLGVPGDFLAPSCPGRLSRGRHMVEIFNSLRGRLRHIRESRIRTKTADARDLGGQHRAIEFHMAVRQFRGGGARAQGARCSR